MFSMIPIFIELTTYSGDKITINAHYIIKMLECTELYMGIIKKCTIIVLNNEEQQNIKVKETIAEIKEAITSNACNAVFRLGLVK